MTSSDGSMGSDGVEAAGPRRRSRMNGDVETQPVEPQGEKPHYMEIENLNQIPLWLAPCHLVAFLFQTMQTLFLFAFAAQVNLDWFLYVNFPGNSNSLSPNEYAMPVQREIAHYSIAWYSGAFIFLSAIDHLVCILPRFRRIHEYYIERHQSPIRWFEYCLSAPLMRVHIAQVAGVTDVHTLWCIFFITHTAIHFPNLHEFLNAKARADGYKQNWLPIYFGVIPHLASWCVIFCYFFAGIKQGDPPAFVGSIVFTLFFLEALFPLCFYLQWCKVGIFRDYLVGEFGFIMLSFTAKTFLAWTTLAGAIGRHRLTTH